MCAAEPVATVTARRAGEQATFTLHPCGSLTVRYADATHGALGTVPPMTADPTMFVTALIALEGWQVTT